MGESEFRRLCELLEKRLDVAMRELKAREREMREYYAKKSDTQKLIHQIEILEKEIKILEKEIQTMKERSKNWRQFFQTNATWLIGIVISLLIFLCENGVFKHMR